MRVLYLLLQGIRIDLEKVNLEQLADVEKHARVNGASIVNLIYVGAVAA